MKAPLGPVFALVLTATIVTGCGKSHTAAAAPASASAPIPAEQVAAKVTWSTGPVTVIHHPAVPPVPVVTGIRYAGHPQEGYDRIVFDIQGGAPGYSARYVGQVVADGSGRPVSVPGNRFLLVVLNPAQAHTESGTVTVTGVHHVGLPTLQAYAVVGDFEGHVSIALGLTAMAGYRVGELSGRIYVDVAH